MSVQMRPAVKTNLRVKATTRSARPDLTFEWRLGRPTKPHDGRQFLAQRELTLTQHNPTKQDQANNHPASVCQRTGQVQSHRKLVSIVRPKRRCRLNAATTAYVSQNDYANKLLPKSFKLNCQTCFGSGPASGARYNFPSEICPMSVCTVCHERSAAVESCKCETRLRSDAKNAAPP